MNSSLYVIATFRYLSEAIACREHMEAMRDTEDDGWKPLVPSCFCFGTREAVSDDDSNFMAEFEVYFTVDEQSVIRQIEEEKGSPLNSAEIMLTELATNQGAAKLVDPMRMVAQSFLAGVEYAT